MNEAGYTGIPSDDVTRLLDAALPAIAADIEQLKIPGIAAVVLGGGYGRGEGGVLHTPEGDRPYNDLDFFVFSRNAGRRDAARIAAALRPVSEKWEKKLQVAIDFGPVKNLDALAAVADTLMFQELLRGWRPVWGQPELARYLPAREPAQLPFTEAARLLLNRGMGLLFAGNELKRPEPDPGFVCRNLNKAYLGAGDAMLIAAGAYHWRGAERVTAFRQMAETTGLGAAAADRYERAWRWKLEPVPRLPEPPEEAWRACRTIYLSAFCRISGNEPGAAPEAVARGLRTRARSARSFRHFLRWLIRARGIRPTALFDDPVVSLAARLYQLLTTAETCPPCPESLLRLWRYFN